MLHNQQSRQIINQIKILNGSKGYWANHAKKGAHRKNKPLIYHNARKKERRNDCFIILRQISGLGFPNFFDINIYLFVKLDKNLIRFNG
ncbi:hypothetical protein SDC9_163105 [bioreactor metagenome]|uniref:Uncharacterized protein n=1 Tax=bioreactor metagenome TaxID=1076179 RepID=A0A645FQU9_9ZZZZ